MRQHALKTIESRQFRISRLRDLNDRLNGAFGYKGHHPEDETIFNTWRESVSESKTKFVGLYVLAPHQKSLFSGRIMLTNIQGSV